MDILSNRIKNMAESATLAMAAKAREYKAKGINVISLSLGEPDFKTPQHIQDGAKAAIDEGKYFAYPPVNGYADLREAISAKFKNENGLEYGPDQIVVSNGAKQSIANIFQAIINEGDEVVVFSPFWVSYSALIELAGGVPVYVKGSIDNDFKATAAQLAEVITPKTKAMIFSSPCNPTGSVFTKAELEAIAEVVLKHENMVVVSDEIYEHINYTGAHASIGAIPGMIDRTVTVNGMAKGFAMTGWRVGYIGAPLWLAKACNKIQGQFTSANCSIAQRAALTALTTDLAPTQEMAKEYLRRREMVKELLDEIPGVKTNVPQGAFYFFPDVSAYFGKSDGTTTINNASDLAMYILDNAHVSVVTGEAFGDPDCIRLSYAASEENLRKAIAQIKEALAKLS
ncbi:pyridoxal phosphate-dependent aminotransferase [Roseivirga pacifica]|uniref:pyridoxal phosphate-dependent aminotransferase n=1 Tax=Roseivirga pacifica TaxID=1267423 RepID=UPI0020964BA8|nr:pyridoxal phosphate-dependent aminotransferase [Roseivirga pacifica]MCO6359648.1 aminotransferase class I/II-fold pyridoxal phosphate-dependent enzyme [Roseivirga pacifica]MCO6367018.1 aminotransferase class I/II-fold pyridoxal phosphate-dependent enzyme [Roseivirga pacifica]MCO6370450.1 aminotransferase class I/II-fold pyridoxal phosphate-dependent enzyme [Roseivirga pacifica]MCO6374675.1 aminotransferase class I/II-fold pyridoxal phosphate-dependent enzyme [Roseivirga pacifica]MCO6379933.